LFLQSAGRDAVDFGQIDVQHDTLATYLQNRIVYPFGRDEVSRAFWRGHRPRIPARDAESRRGRRFLTRGAVRAVPRANG